MITLILLCVIGFVVGKITWRYATDRVGYKDIKVGTVLELSSSLSDITGIVFNTKHDPAARIDGSYQQIKYFIYLKETKEFMTSSKKDIIFEDLTSGRIALTNERLGLTVKMIFSVAKQKAASSVIRQIRQQYEEKYGVER